MRISGLLLISGLLAVAAGCAGTPRQDAAAPAQPSLYEQIGGQAAVEALVDALVAEYKRDPRIAARFDLPPADIAYLRERLIEQLCQATGGPCEYQGLAMVEAHSGMAISGAEFDAFMQDTNKAMTTLGVKDEHQLVIVGVLEGMRGDVIDQ
jgi:hemoglobin